MVAGAGAAALWPMPAALVDRWFGRALYPELQRALTAVSNLVPFALLDPLMIGAAALAVWGCVSVWRSAPGRRRGVALRRIWQGLAVAAGVYLAFLACWGLNYQRPPVTDAVDFNRERITPEAVRTLNATALDEAGSRQGRAAWAAR